MPLEALAHAATEDAPEAGDPAIRSNVEPLLRDRSRSLRGRALTGPRPEAGPRLLNPDALGDHVDQLYRAAWALCGSRHDAEDLVQETFANVLKRPRRLRGDNAAGYLLRALRNTYASRYRSIAKRPIEHRLTEDDVLPVHESDVNAREIMEAIASAPAHYRDAVIAVDLLGLSYREAARAEPAKRRSQHASTADGNTSHVDTADLEAAAARSTVEGDQMPLDPQLRPRGDRRLRRNRVHLPGQQPGGGPRARATR